MKSADKQYQTDQCRAYHERANGCEVTPLLRLSDEFCKWERHCHIHNYEAHHIYGRGSRFHNQWTNLCMTTTAAHMFGHDAPVRAFNAGHALELVCLVAKARLHQKMMNGPLEERETRQDRQHWERDTLEHICGYKTLLGRVEMLCDSLADTVFAPSGNWLLSVIETPPYLMPGLYGVPVQTLGEKH